MIYDFVQLDRKASSPICSQLSEEIKQGIISGKIQTGIRVPSIRLAASELEVSKTTVESAYIRLCSEGFLESRPQSGYFVRMPRSRPTPVKTAAAPMPPIRYSFASGRIDPSAADLPVWKKHVRAALNNETDITSYGHPQGEECLRKAISDYAYTARGVISEPENIVIGAGTQILLLQVCSLCTQKYKVAIAEPGFQQAQRIFTDFGLRTVLIEQTTPEAMVHQLKASGASFFLDIPSNIPKMPIHDIKARRAALLEWLHAEKGRYIIEDDYNGELRYRARPLASMQSFDPQRILYLGSFSHLLLPSVRAAYMVLPDSLLQKYHLRAHDYNQTAGKIEQIALAQYIRQGHLEKHLRRLKKLYYDKSKALVHALQSNLASLRTISVLETSLSVILTLDTGLTDQELTERALAQGIEVSSIKKGQIRLSFAGIAAEDIEPAVGLLRKAWS